MLAELGCRYVIVGHSERRALHGETDVVVAEKAEAALAHGLTPIVCVGETLAEREAGATEAVVARQLAARSSTGSASASTAIGHRLRAGLGDRHRQDRHRPRRREAVHAYRAQLGSPTPGPRATPCASSTAAASRPTTRSSSSRERDIDGGLIGGASLKAHDFVAICRAAN